MKVSIAFAAALCGTLAVASLIATPAAPWLSGLSADLLLLGRKAIGAEPPRSDQVAVIALDEETYRRAPFTDTPRVTWTPHLGEVIAAVLDAGAIVVGQDIILPTSLEAFAPGLDKPYLEALVKGAASGRLVLGAVRHQGDAIGPHATYRFLAQGDQNIRYLNLAPDPDGVIRSATPVLGGGTMSFAAELALRAGASPEPGERLINMRGDKNTALTYSLADLQACEDDEFMRRAFNGKVVVIGAILDIEDRKSTSARFLSREDAATFAPRCAYPVMKEFYADSAPRARIPGVMIHAQIVEDLLAGKSLVRPPAVFEHAVLWGLAFAAALIVLTARIRTALIAGPMSAVAIVGASLGFLMNGIVVAALTGVLAALLSGGFAYVHRFFIADREKRRVQQSFAKYLSPDVVEQLVESGKAPGLGGEMRVVTIWFSDLENFTTMSQSMAPDELVGALNKYLSIVTDAITSHGGMIDKYIGDAVVGVFGAPLEDPQHAASGLAAARACFARLEALRAENPDWPATRIGMHTGEVLVGNIGSNIRLDYTVMGDAVNLAARLESLNKRFGSYFLASGDVVEHAKAEGMRHVDTVQVKGRSEPTEVFSFTRPLDDRQSAQFEHARRLMQEGQFDLAAGLFDSLAEVDPIASRLAQAAREHHDRPPTDWRGYSVLFEK